MASHMMEAVLKFAPDALFSELYTRVFRNKLKRLSLHPKANFVTQALLHSLRDSAQVLYPT